MPAPAWLAPQPTCTWQFISSQRVGSKLDIRDTCGRWVAGSVLQCDDTPDSRGLYVTYDKWSSKWDEWISTRWQTDEQNHVWDSGLYRFAELHRFSRAVRSTYSVPVKREVVEVSALGCGAWVRATVRQVIGLQVHVEAVEGAHSQHATHADTRGNLLSKDNVVGGKPGCPWRRRWFHLGQAEVRSLTPRQQPTILEPDRITAHPKPVIAAPRTHPRPPSRQVLRSGAPAGVSERPEWVSPSRLRSEADSRRTGRDRTRDREKPRKQPLDNGRKYLNEGVRGASARDPTRYLRQRQLQPQQPPQPHQPHQVRPQQPLQPQPLASFAGLSLTGSNTRSSLDNQRMGTWLAAARHRRALCYPHSTARSHDCRRVGIHNLGNTCYINAVLQCLASLPPLVHYFSQWLRMAATGKLRRRKQSLSWTLGSSICYLSDGGRTINTECDAQEGVDVRTLKQRVGTLFAGNREEDSHEFMCALLERVHQELNAGHAAPNVGTQGTEDEKDEKARQRAQDREQDLAVHASTVLEKYQAEETIPAGTAQSPLTSNNRPPLTAQCHSLQNGASQSCAAWSMFRWQNASVISDLFYGLRRSVVRCDKCSYHSTRHTEFAHIPLDIPPPRHGYPSSAASSSSSWLHSRMCTAPMGPRSRPSPSPSSSLSLYDCFDYMSRKERLVGDDRYLCPRCTSKQCARKQETFARLPSILVIQLKRFRVAGASSTKIRTPVHAPSVLDLRPLLAERRKTRVFLRNNPLASHLADKKQMEQLAGARSVPGVYRLVGVVLHTQREGQGRTLSRHYTALCRTKPCQDPLIIEPQTKRPTKGATTSTEFGSRASRAKAKTRSHHRSKSVGAWWRSRKAQAESVGDDDAEDHAWALFDDWRVQAVDRKSVMRQARQSGYVFFYSAS